MEERIIVLDAAESAFAVAALEHKYWGDWCWVGDDRVAWTASVEQGGRSKDRCFVHERGGRKIKALGLRSTHGPITTADELVAGGGANGATPLVFRQDTLKKVGSLKGHKSTIHGLATVHGPDRFVTIGGKNSTPFDDTVRLWDPSTFAETGRIKLKRRPRSLATGRDRIYVQTWAHRKGSELHAFDASLELLWTVEDREKVWVHISVSHDGQTLAEVQGDVLLLRDRSGDVRAQLDLKPHGRCRLARAWGGPGFSPDDRWLFVTPEYKDAGLGTLVVDVATGKAVLRLRGVLRPRPRPGGGYGAWMGSDGGITSYSSPRSDDVAEGAICQLLRLSIVRLDVAQDVHAGYPPIGVVSSVPPWQFAHWTSLGTR